MAVFLVFVFETFPTTYEERSRLDVVYGALRRLAAAAFPILKFEITHGNVGAQHTLRIIEAHLR